jgi:hypothetical protein
MGRETEVSTLSRPIPLIRAEVSMQALVGAGAEAGEKHPFDFDRRVVYWHIAERKLL